MFGAEVGSLTVKSASNVLWSKSGNQGLSWLAAAVNIPSTVNLQVLTLFYKHIRTRND